MVKLKTTTKITKEKSKKQQIFQFDARAKNIFVHLNCQ